MRTKNDIVQNWLPRYVGMPLESFGEYILLVNFFPYVRMFAEHYGVPIYGVGDTKPMQAATANNITIVNFPMGSPMAALIMEMLTAIPHQDPVDILPRPKGRGFLLDGDVPPREC